ncbi:hypothetical protein HY251_16890, partial [bacterium]|nr:hypothetical protein [bacterium]
MAGSQQSTKANRATKTGKTHQVPIRIHEDVELTLQNPKGKPVPDWHYVVKDVDGEIHEGKLDANGHAKVRVPRGKCIVKLTPEPPRKESRPAPE